MTLAEALIVGVAPAPAWIYLGVLIERWRLHRLEARRTALRPVRATGQRE